MDGMSVSCSGGSSPEQQKLMFMQVHVSLIGLYWGWVSI